MALKSDFSIDLNVVNRIYKDSENFTLDIDIPMNNRINASFMQFINRFDSVKEITDMSGEIKVDNQTVIKGKVKVLSISDDIVKIQLVDNSDTFFFKDENDEENNGQKRIDLLPLGTNLNFYAFPVKNQKARESVVENPDFNYVEAACIPVAKEYTREVTVSGDVDAENKMFNSSILEDFLLDPDTNIAPQPYLYVIINKIAEAIGYKIVRNDLDNIRIAKNILIISDYTGMSLAYSLPPWGVAKFFIEIEKLFNVKCEFNRRDMTLSIKSVNSEGWDVFETVALDEYDSDVEEEEEAEDNEFRNVRYSFPDNDNFKTFYAEADLNDEQYEQFRKLQVGSLSDAVPAAPPTLANLKHYSFVRYADESSPIPVNNYRHIGKSSAENARELNIVPAPTSAFYPFYPLANYRTPDYINIPVALHIDKPEQPIPRKDSKQLITEGVVSEKPDNSQKMLIACFARRLPCRAYGQGVPDINKLYPNVEVNLSCSFRFSEKVLYSLIDGKDYSLSLENLQEIVHYYSESNFKVLFKIQARLPFIPDISKMKLLVKGQLFIPVSVKYNIDNKGFAPFAEVEAYRVL